jgi:DNA-binding NarL/FixJ family response regulator
MQEPRVLVLDDEPLVRRALARLLRAHGRVVAAASVREASALVADGRPWRALFLDLRLPDGSGLDVLARARAADSRAPAMVLTGSIEAEAINTAHDLRATYVVKPLDGARIARFLADAAPATMSLATVVARWTSAYGLRAAEADVLRRAAAGETREQIAAARVTSALTVKKQAANLLRRTGDGSLHAAVERLLREAMG